MMQMQMQMPCPPMRMLLVPPMVRATTNQAKLAALTVHLNIRLRSADMSGAMQERAFQRTRAVLDANLEKKPNPTRIAMCLKKVSNGHTSEKFFLQPSLQL